jgi:hypothetical protein
VIGGANKWNDIGRGSNKWNDIVWGSIKIWSTQVGGASSQTCMLYLNVHYICLLAWHKHMFAYMAQVLFLW